MTTIYIPDSVLSIIIRRGSEAFTSPTLRIMVRIANHVGPRSKSEDAAADTAEGIYGSLPNSRDENYGDAVALVRCMARRGYRLHN